MGSVSPIGPRKVSPGLLVNKDGEMGFKFLERQMNLGFRQSGTTVFKGK
jgi:hypothetical protein